VVGTCASLLPTGRLHCEHNIERLGYRLDDDGREALRDAPLWRMRQCTRVEATSATTSQDRTQGGAAAVDKSPQTGIEPSVEKAEEECAAVWGYPHESTSTTELFRCHGLTISGFEDDDARVVLLFIRLRSLLFASCPDHPVARCGTCHRTYTPEQLGTKISDGCYLCRDCGGDLRESVVAHARTCPNLIPQKPLARMAPVTRPTAVSERFAARRRVRLGLDTDAAAG
jgi:hypothetical protein